MRRHETCRLAFGFQGIIKRKPVCLDSHLGVEEDRLALIQACKLHLPFPLGHAGRTHQDVLERLGKKVGQQPGLTQQLRQPAAIHGHEDALFRIPSRVRCLEMFQAELELTLGKRFFTGFHECRSCVGAGRHAAAVSTTVAKDRPEQEHDRREREQSCKHGKPPEAPTANRAIAFSRCVQNGFS